MVPSLLFLNTFLPLLIPIDMHVSIYMVYFPARISLMTFWLITIVNLWINFNKKIWSLSVATVMGAWIILSCCTYIYYDILLYYTSGGPMSVSCDTRSETSDTNGIIWKIDVPSVGWPVLSAVQSIIFYFISFFTLLFTRSLPKTF